MKRKIIFFISLIFFLLIINYFTLIPLNVRYTSFATIILMLLFLFYLIFIKKNKEQPYIKIGDKLVNSLNKNIFIDFIIIIIIIFIPTFYSILSSPLLFSKQYQQLIGEVKEKAFTKDFAAIETTQLPIIDKSLATLLGEKKLGYDRGLGSEFHVGNFNDISVQGRLVAIAPLEYNGFFKWLNNDGTPGFIVVDKVTGDVELINELNNKEISLKYLPSAYLNEDLLRYIYMKGHIDNKLYSYTFEVDEEMNPYWIINKTKKNIGISGGDDVKSIIIVNAITGEINEYNVDEVPEWVDTVYPDSLVMKQLDDWGLYVNGYLNTIFGEKNIVRITSGSRRVYNNGNIYHYTGLTSTGSDDATIGFAFINAKTKETILYKITGATEEAAMRSAEGKVQNLRYCANFPLPINVNDIPTFFLTLKDDSKLIKQYAFVNIESFDIVGNGETIKQAKNNYLKLLNEENIYIEEKEKETIIGEITRIGFDINDGEIIYYIVIDNNSTIYYLDSSISSEIIITKIGDKVTLEVSDSRVIKFNNNSLFN